MPPPAIAHGRTDALVVAGAAVATAATFVTSLGFYSDDWVLLARFTLHPDQSVAALFAAFSREHFSSRPMQALYSILLYRAFGDAPLGYHVVNSLVIAAAAVLLRGILARAGAPRLAALSVALVFAVMPHFSTARFWYAAFAAPLSVLLYLASVRAELAAVGEWPRRALRWRLAALVLLAAGLLAYEITLPLALATPVVVWLAARAQGDARWPAARWVTLAAPIVALVVGVGIFKVETSRRLGARGVDTARVSEMVRTAFRSGQHEGDYGFNVPLALQVHGGDLVARLPASVMRLRSRVPGPALPVGALAFALLCAGYLRRAGMEEHWTPRAWAAVALAGLAVFAGGFAVFLTNSAIQVTAAGMANRTAIAAAMGLAMMLVGSLGALVSVLPGNRLRAVVFSTVVAVYAGVSVMAVAIVASYWEDAYPAQRAVVASIQRALPVPPPRLTLFLGGVCPYIGPVPVFESSWDLAFALRLAYREPTIAGDVVGPAFHAGPESITTALYGERYEWPYGTRTVLYDARRGRWYTLLDRAATVDALRESRLPARDCPPAVEGVGVRILAQGR